MLGDLMARNFALRRQIFGDAIIGAANLKMVEIAESFGGDCLHSSRNYPPLHPPPPPPPPLRPCSAGCPQIMMHAKTFCTCLPHATYQQACSYFGNVTIHRIPGNLEMYAVLLCCCLPFGISKIGAAWAHALDCVIKLAETETAQHRCLSMPSKGVWTMWSQQNDD